jgi:ribosomal protein S18 acetylase RimI-like enzyme
MMEREASRNLEGLEIGALDASEVEEALGVISRGMRDNPIHIAAFGEGQERRQKSLHRLFGAAFAVMGLQEHMLVARGEDGRIMGVMGVMPPGDCLPGPGQRLRMLPSLLRNGPRAAGRTMSWLGSWAKRDPQERHWHFGPLAVDAHLQGRGIGSKLMRVFCARMDAPERRLPGDRQAGKRPPLRALRLRGRRRARGSRRPKLVHAQAGREEVSIGEVPEELPHARRANIENIEIGRRSKWLEQVTL